MVLNKRKKHKEEKFTSALVKDCDQDAVELDTGSAYSATELNCLTEVYIIADC